MRAQDQRHLNRLLTKVKQHMKDEELEKTQIKAITDKYKMSKDDIDKLVAWKHSHTH